jgi:hypothetical protein
VLNGCTRITDTQIWLRSILAELEKGKSAPRWKHGVLQQDLLNLDRVLRDHAGLGYGF